VNNNFLLISTRKAKNLEEKSPLSLKIIMRSIKNERLEKKRRNKKNKVLLT